MPYRKRAVAIGMLAAAYWMLLFMLTHVSISAPEPVEGMDKAAHAGAYAVLAMLLCAAASTLWPFGPRVAAGVICLIAAYGAIDELTQSLTRDRTPDAWDWFADVIGAAAGTAVLAVARAWYRGRRQQSREAPAAAPRE